MEKGYLLYGRYRIESVLGRGGMGSVYKAVDENLGIPVAVKENLFSTEEYARQFRREASILASLRHNNLPRVTDHFVLPGQGQYLVMDFVDGDDLRTRIERGQIPNERQALEWTRQICDALHYLHTRQPPVVHRDIKPGNIRITPEGRAVLVDFGLARLMEGTSTTTGAKAMTPGYSPPEQYGASRTDTRTDIYALAATLYSLLTGVMPEDGLERALGQKALTPIRNRNPKVSPGFAMAIEQSLEVLPEQRYQTIDEFFTAINSSVPVVVDVQQSNGANGRKVADPAPRTIARKEAGSLPPDRRDSGGAAQKSKPAPHPKPQNRISTGCLIGLGLAGLAIVAVLIVLLTKGSQLLAVFAPGGSTPTQSEIQASGTAAAMLPSMAGGLPSNTPIRPTDTKTPTITLTPYQTPLGKSGVIAFAANKTGIPQIYSMALADGIWHQITDLPEGACEPDWSPDGTQLVFISPCKTLEGPYSRTTVYRMNADGSGRTSLTKVPNGDYEPAWSPDGKSIAVTSLRDNGLKHIYILDINGDNPVLVSKAGATNDSQPRWSPDGKQIIFVTNGGVHYIDLTKKQPWDYIPFFSINAPTASPDWSIDNFILLVFKGQVVVSNFASHNTPFPIMKQSYMGVTVARFSPDGQEIIFDCQLDCSLSGLTPSITGRDLYLLSIVGADVAKRLTSDPGDESDPVWRPITPGA